MHRARRKQKHDNWPWRTWLLWTTVILVPLGTVAFWLYQSQHEGEQASGTVRQVDENVTLVLSPASEMPRHTRPNLAGPASCAECHRANYDGYRLTKHPITCRPVEAEKMPDGFHQNQQFQSAHTDIRFEMSRDDTHFYQTSIQATPGGQRTQRTKIDLVLGAGGTADDVFLSWRDDGQLRELPMAWLYPTQEWAASHFDPLSGADFSRAMTLRCVECHNTWVEHVIGSPNSYRPEGAMLGVTCESCHGPAGEHVQFHRAHPEQKQPQHIANPAKMERERRLEVCTQCHSNAMRHRTHAFAYRPGQPLDTFYKTLPTSATEDDRVANQISYLRQSKCFQQDDRLTCVTCHNPHRGSDVSISGAASCAKCHAAHDCRDAPNLPQAVRGDCVSCHMPSYLKINVNFQTQHDNFVPPIRRTEHRIAVHRHARDETLWKYFLSQEDHTSKESVRVLQEKLVAYYKNEAQQCQQQFRFLGVIAALREVVRFDNRAEHVEQLRSAVKFQNDLDLKFVAAMEQLAQNNTQGAIATFQNILSLNPRDAKAHGRLGMEFAKLGDRQRANEHFEAVTKHDPNDVYGVAMLAWLAYLDGKYEDSLRLYAQAEEIEPREAKMKYQIALVHFKLGQTSAAIDKLKLALEIEPLHPESMQTLVRTLLETGQAKSAVPYAERAARATNSENAHVLAMLADVYLAAADLTQAKTAYRLAMRHALAQDPSIIPSLQQALDQLNSSTAK